MSRVEISSQNSRHTITASALRPGDFIESGDRTFRVVEIMQVQDSPSLLIFVHDGRWASITLTPDQPVRATMAADRAPDCDSWWNPHTEQTCALQHGQWCVTGSGVQPIRHRRLPAAAR